MTRIYSEFSYYSPFADCDMVRISMDDGCGGELFMEIEDVGGKVFRKTKQAALDDLEEAIDLGLQPGRVVRGT